MQETITTILDTLTTILDTLGLLLLAAGAAALAYPYIGWGSLAIAGFVVLAGSQLAAGAVGRLQAWRRSRTAGGARR